jgi:hypothetical protein
MNKGKEAGMHAVTKVMGNVYFCDFESDERKFARSSSQSGALPMEPAVAGLAAGEEADAGTDHRNTMADPEVA